MIINEDSSFYTIYGEKFDEISDSDGYNYIILKDLEEALAYCINYRENNDRFPTIEQNYPKYDDSGRFDKLVSDKVTEKDIWRESYKRGLINANVEYKL